MCAITCNGTRQPRPPAIAGIAPTIPTAARAFSPRLPDHVFRNDRGRFVDVTAEAGIVDPDGRGLGVVAADLDDDGKTDLFVANDQSANYFFRNRGGFRFVEEGVAAGLAGNAQRRLSGRHGSGLRRLRRRQPARPGRDQLPGRIDDALSQPRRRPVQRPGGRGRARRADPLRSRLRAAALDANNDGRLDLAQANGHVEDRRPTNPYAMPAQLFLGDATGRFIDVSDRAGSPWQVPRLGRGLAAGDLDNDGRIDLLLVAQDLPLALLRNRAASQNHFLTLGLEGTTSNRDAVGAHGWP